MTNTNTLFTKPSLVVLTLLFTLFYHEIIAQESLWSVNLSEPILEVGWIEQANDGTIIAAGAKGIMGIESSTGKTLWHNPEFKGISQESFCNIDGLPFFFVEYAPAVAKTRGLILQANNGQVLFDTEEENYRIKHYTIVPEKAMILFELTKEKMRILLAFDLKSQQKLWITPLGDKYKSVEKQTQNQARSFLDHGPIFTQSGHMLVCVNEFIYSLNPLDGKIAWSHESEKEITELVYAPLNNQLYYGMWNSTKLFILDPQSGQDITPGKLKLKGSLVDITQGTDNNIILTESAGFNLVNPATNEFLWKKSYAVESLAEVIPFENGFIAVGKSTEKGTIAYVSSAGEKIWETQIKGYPYYTGLTSQGVLYISTERSNIISFESGKEIWKKDVKFESIPAVTFDETEKKVVLFENGRLLKFDMASGEMNIQTENIKLTGIDKKTPLKAEYIDAGYLMYTEQNLSLIDQQGNLLYSKEYPQTSSTNFFKLAEYGMRLAGVDLDIEGAIENITTLNRIAQGGYLSSNNAKVGTSQTEVVSGAYAGNSPLFEVTKTRFSNSQQTKKYFYVLTKDKEGQAIYMVNKNSGNTEKRIGLLDKTPQYVVDNIDNRVFINEKNKTVTCYKMF